MKFECASNAAEVLGCDLEELTTAVFKHHLKQILAQVMARGSRLPPAEESLAGTGMLHPFFLYLWVIGKHCALCCSGLFFSGHSFQVHLSMFVLIKLLTVLCHVATLSSIADPACHSLGTPEDQVNSDSATGR